MSTNAKSMDNQSNSRKRLLYNILSNLSIYLINVLIGLLFTPYLIRKLGVSLYGLIPLATNISTYLSIFTLMVNGALGRYLAIDIQTKDVISANKTFNTGFFGTLIITIFILPFLFVLIPKANLVFNIPYGFEDSAVAIFTFAIATFIVTQFDSCFSVSTWVHSRFDLRGLITNFGNITRVILSIVFFESLYPSLNYIGLAMLISSLLVISGDYIVFKRLTPQLSVKLRYLDKARIKEIFGMGWWTVINQIGTLLFINIDLVIANIALGAEVGGRYGSIVLFSTMFRSFATAISSVFSPIIVNKYSNNEHSFVIEFTKRSVKFLGIIVGLLVGLLSGLSKPFLMLWLGSSFTSLWPLMILLIAHLPVNLAVLPLYGVQNAYLRIRLPGIVTIIFGTLNVILAYLLSTRTNLGVYGIALASAIILTLKNAFFTSIYTACVQKIPWNSYLTPIIPGILLTLMGIVAGIFIQKIIYITNWTVLFLMGSCLLFILILFIWYIFLDNKDKLTIRSLLNMTSN